jgi:hypothetical protein
MQIYVTSCSDIALILEGNHTDAEAKVHAYANAHVRTETQAHTYRDIHTYKHTHIFTYIHISKELTMTATAFANNLSTLQKAAMAANNA